MPRKIKKWLYKPITFLLALALLTQSAGPAFGPLARSISKSTATASSSTPPITSSDNPLLQRDANRPPAPPNWYDPPTLRRVRRSISQALQPGWNLVSINEEPADSDPAVVLASLAGSYDKVYAFDGCDGADPWKVYDPADLPGSDLTAIDHRLGFWVEMTATDTLNVSGTAHPTVTIPLCTGWNLISYPLAQPQKVTTALASIDGKYSRVYGYEATLGTPWDVYSPGLPDYANDLEVMSPGYGYWILATEAVTLTMSEPPGPDITPPIISLTAQPEIVDPGQTVYLGLSVNDDSVILTKTLTVNGLPVTLDENDLATYIPAAAGLYTATATAVDLYNNSSTATAYFRARSPVDDGPPQVALLAPPDDTTITVTQTLSGTASDSDLVFYTLQARPLDSGTFITFARGFSPVLTDTLGSLDPRAFRAGLYEVRLCAEDSWGNRTCSNLLRYSLEANNPLPGIMRMAFLDGSLYAAGLPLTVRRVYDSRDKEPGDFGVGWRMMISEITLYANRVMGNDWAEQVVGSTYHIVPTADHRITVKLPDGSFHRFRMHPDPESQAFTPITILNGATFEPLGGTTAQLTTSDPPDLFDSVTGTILDGSGGIYSPANYTLTLQDGSKFTFTRNGSVAALTYRLTRVEDPNGNFVTISPTGLTHSAGVSIGISRDSEGRVTTITDGNGNSRTYTYDSRGDLVATTDYDGYLTQYIYDDNHNLMQIVDPRGSIPGTLIYDENNRIVATIDAQGNEVAITHDAIAGQDVVTDPLGNTIIIGYDSRGNMVSRTNQESQTTTYLYDNDDNLLTTTDPLGNTQSWGYNGAGQVLSYTDALNNTTQWSYNGLGKIATITDALGRVTTYQYDSQANLTAITYPLGITITYEYDGNGNQTAITDALGNRYEIDYDSVGNPLRVTDALGNSTVTTYDGNGLPLTIGLTVTTDAGVEFITVNNNYDKSGRLLSRTDPYGNSTTIAYSPIGRPSQVTDRNGQPIATTYGASGQIDATTLPGGATLSYEYDARGLPYRQQDFSGSIVETIYDPIGRTDQVLLPDGTSTSQDYDAAGRMTEYIDENGNVMSISYDPLGRQTEVNRSGAIYNYSYDAVGNLLSWTDADGGVTSYTYNDFDQVTAINQPDGTIIKQNYDALGRLIETTDPLSTTTTYSYDALGNLTQITDPLGGVTRYAYNEANQIVSITNPLSQTITFAYDRLGRLTERTLPSGDSESFVYDNNDNLIAYTDFNGQTTTYTYTSLNQVAGKQFPDGSTVAYAYDLGGRLATITDTTGVTSYTYDSRGRMTSVTYPGGDSISYTYDDAGNLASRTTPSGTISYTYDAQDRLVTVTDPDSGLTAYGYGSGGNLNTITYPNGTVMSTTYDLMGRPSQINHLNPGGTPFESYAYTYDDNGNRTQIVDLAGNTTTYTYDDLNRLIGESQTDNGGTTVYDIQYTYDALGNRLSRIDTSSTLTYTYDNNNRLLSAGAATFTYDANGNQLARTEGGQVISYTYDFENQLIGVISPTLGVTYTYNGAGIRVAAQDGANTVNYLVDVNTPYPEVLETRDGGGSLLASFVRGAGWASISDGTDRAYYHVDAHNNVRYLTDNSGAVTDSYDYLAFGELRQHSGSSTNPLLYSSEWRDPATGFDYLRARHYAPVQGRFLSADQVIGSLTDPTTLNPYAYVGNNPVTRADPSGNVSGAEALVAANIASTLNAMQAVGGLSFGIAFQIFSNPDLLRPPAHAGRFAVTASVELSYLGLMSGGVAGGLEALYFTPEAEQSADPYQYYYFLGLTGSVGNAVPMPGAALDASLSFEIGHVFNCAESIDCYDGWSFGLSASGNYLNFSGAFALFSGASSRFSGTAANGYGVGFGMSVSLSHDSSVRPPVNISDLYFDTSVSLGVGVLYYWRVSGDPSLVREASTVTVAGLLQSLGGDYVAEYLATPGPIRSQAESFGPALVEWLTGSTNR